jgi:hypothetical protein
MHTKQISGIILIFVPANSHNMDMISRVKAMQINSNSNFCIVQASPKTHKLLFRGCQGVFQGVKRPECVAEQSLPNWCRGVSVMPN